MSTVGRQREILTQQRVISFFRNALRYAYLGHWQDRGGNSHVEKGHLTRWLKGQGHGVSSPEAVPSYPATISTSALRSLFDNLENTPRKDMHLAEPRTGQEAGILLGVHPRA